MQRKIIVTGDKSKTLLIPELNETYHSENGAITEANHVFIQAGLNFAKQNELSIFEMGFGTGLNAILTLLEIKKSDRKISYECIESDPLKYAQAVEMDYVELPELSSLKDAFEKMHTAGSNELIRLDAQFSFRKYISKIQRQALESNKYDLVYYDAFSPKVQGELWQKDVLAKISDSMKSGGILVTYCAQGAFKRTLKELKMHVENIPGPPGKREMTRAIKP